MGCACGSRANIEEHIRDFINDMVISKTSINEYKRNLAFAIQNDKFYEQEIFEKEFLDPLFESVSGNFKDFKKHVLEYFYEIKNENFILFIVSLSFLCDTINFASLKSNYEIILYDTLPADLTKLVRSKNDLRVFKKFVKFYVKMVSQYIVGALETIYSQNIEDKNALEDLKIIYSNVYVNEFIRRLFVYENEKDFNLEKFLKLNYESLKHNAVREKLFEIYSTSPKLHYENDFEETDIFSFVESEKGAAEEEEDANVTNNFEKLDFHIEKSEEEISAKAEKSFVAAEEPLVAAGAKKEALAHDDETISKAATHLSKYAKGISYRKQFKTTFKPELEKQQSRIHEYIVSNFPSEKVKKAEANRKQDFAVDGWKKFYPANTKIFNINHGEVHETKFLIFNGNEYYSGLLNRKSQKHGFGISIHRQGEKYQGFFFENNYHGWGELIDKSGNIFQGQFVHGVLSGKGEKFALDGSYYIGDFDNFSKHGEGQEDSEFYIYRGGFKNNKKNGKGKIYMKVLKDSYEGDFLDDTITGLGEYRWSNENTYVGEFINGKMHGKGINKWPDGTVYEGEYKNGIKEGFGRYTKPNKKTYEGYLKNGKPHGKGILISDKGSFEVEFSEGKMISGPESSTQIAKKNGNKLPDLNKDEVEKAEEKAKEIVQEKVDKTKEKVEKAEEKVQEKVEKAVLVNEEIEKAQNYALDSKNINQEELINEQ